MAQEDLVDRISRALEDLGGEARLADIRNRIWLELGGPDSSRSQHYHRISYTIRQHSQGHGSDRFEKVDEGRYHLKDAWLYHPP